MGSIPDDEPARPAPSDSTERTQGEARGSYDGHWFVDGRQLPGVVEDYAGRLYQNGRRLPFRSTWNGRLLPDPKVLLEEAPPRPGPKPELSPTELHDALVQAICFEWKRLRKRPNLGHLALYFSKHPTLPRLDADALRQRIKRAGLDLKALYREGQPPA